MSENNDNLESKPLVKKEPFWAKYYIYDENAPKRDTSHPKVFLCLVNMNFPKPDGRVVRLIKGNQYVLRVYRQPRRIYVFTLRGKMLDIVVPYKYINRVFYQLKKSHYEELGIERKYPTRKFAKKAARHLTKWKTAYYDQIYQLRFVEHHKKIKDGEWSEAQRLARILRSKEINHYELPIREFREQQHAVAKSKSDKSSGDTDK